MSDTARVTDVTEVHLRRYADIYRVTPVLNHQGLPDDFELLKRADLDDIYQHNSLMVCATGRIYCSQPEETRTIERVRNLLTASGAFKREELRVVPTHRSVIENVIEQGEAEAQEYRQERNELQDEEKSRARNDIESLIKDAMRIGSSDIHIHVRGSRASISMRIDGALKHIHSAWTAPHAQAMCSAVVDGIAGDSDGVATHFKINEPVDATAKLKIDGEALKIRFASTPRSGGFKAVLRILKSFKRGSLTLSELGYLDEQRLVIEQIAAAPQGLVMVGGPTGSGKTTTLALVMDLFGDDKAMYSYEDPVEIENERICQVMVEPESPTCNWVAHSKNTLRMDPDIIQYGELRANEVAEQIVNAASTGHLVLATVHTNSAPLIVQRLNDLGIEYRRLGEPEFLKVLIFQRLLPKTCSACSTSLDAYTTSDPVVMREVERLRSHFQGDASYQNIQVAVEGQNCKECSGTGRSGRVLVAEVVRVDDKGREFIRNANIGEWIGHLKRQGWRSTIDHAEINVKRGILCPLRAETLLGKQFDDLGHQDSFNYEEFRQQVEEMFGGGLPTTQPKAKPQRYLSSGGDE